MSNIWLLLTACTFLSTFICTYVMYIKVRLLTVRVIYSLGIVVLNTCIVRIFKVTFSWTIAFISANVQNKSNIYNALM